METTGCLAKRGRLGSDTIVWDARVVRLAHADRKLRAVKGTPPMSTSVEKSSWEPTLHTAQHGRLDAAQLDALPESAFAFPRARKEPMTDASHVRSALARFNQVTDVTDAERDLAFANIEKAARYYSMELRETDWRQLGQMPRSNTR